jgi:hypothetical protein
MFGLDAFRSTRTLRHLDGNLSAGDKYMSGGNPVGCIAAPIMTRYIYTQGTL